MKEYSNQFLGIDLGGTNLKIALVDTSGNITKHRKYSTVDLRENGNFTKNILKIIGKYLKAHPHLEKVGIGIPGTLNKKRTTILEVPAIPQLDGINLKKAFCEKFPDIDLFLENDANAAALGEYHFGKDAEKLPDNFIFITMGTGIGGAAIINGKIFSGGDGNGMEVGHIFSRNSSLLENNIGKKGIIKLAKKYLDDLEDQDKYDFENVSSSDLVTAAMKSDPLALSVFKTVGEILGEAMVSVIRILDIKTIIIGGGLSSSFELISDPLNTVLNQHLTPYYTKKILIKRATLGNQAGVIGAASLCFQEVLKVE